MKQKIRWTAMGIAALAVFPSWAATSPGYKVEDKIRIEGDQGWDLLAVDDSSGAVFLTHGDRVQAVDPGTGKLLGTVTGIDGAHGVALVPDIGKGYATSGKDSAVVVFDLKTFTTLARLHTPGAKPDAIQFDPASRRVFAGLAGSDELAAFDVATSKLAGTVSLPGNPELMAVDGKGMLFVNIENKSEVAAIDAKTLKVVSIWPLAPGEEPTGLAVDPDSKRLFAGCHNHLMVALDATTGKVVASLPVGRPYRRRRLRSGPEARLRSGGRRHPHRDPGTRTGQIHRAGDRGHQEGSPDHRHRRQDPPPVPAHRRLRPHAGRVCRATPPETTPPPWHIHPTGRVSGRLSFL